MSARGSVTEALILGAGQYYRASKLGRIRKRENATVWSRKRKHHVPIGTGAPDFSGHWRGLGFELESKEVSKGQRFVLGHDEADKRRLRAQLLDLEETAASGGLGFLLVNFRDQSRGLREAWLVRIRAGGDLCVLRRWARQAERIASLPVDWFRQNGVRVPDADGGLAWGRAMDEMLRGEA